MAATGSARPVDPVDRAHLTGVTRPSPPIHRYAPSPHLVDLVDRYWIPVWSLPEPSTQSTLQHPVCLVVVSTTYARLYGVVRGRSSVTLEGDGWAVGTMLTPAAGRLLLGRSVATITDTHLDLGEVGTLDAEALTAQVRAAMAADPRDPAAHAAAIAAVERRLEAHLPVDAQGLLVNELVAWVHANPRSPASPTSPRTPDCPSAACSGWSSSASGSAPSGSSSAGGCTTRWRRSRRGSRRSRTWPHGWATPTRRTSPTTSAPSPG